MKYNKQQIMDILQVKKEGLKTIEKKQQLYERLKEKGYVLNKKVKEGRQVYYIIDKDNDYKEILNNISLFMFNTNNDNLFSDYFLLRIFNIEKPITKELIANYCDINRKTVTKLDNKMIEHEILSKDGFFYIACDIKDNKRSYRITCKEEYNSYMKCNNVVNKRHRIIQKLKNNEIDEESALLMLDALTMYNEAIENKFVYKIHKFMLHKENELYKDIFNLIENTYNAKIKSDEYYLEWLPEGK